MLTYRVLHGADEIRSIVDPWLDLWGETNDPNPFLHPAWQMAWITTFAPGRTVAAMTAFEGERLCAVWPLWRSIGGLWRPCANVVSDYLHPLGAEPQELVDGVVQASGWRGMISAPNMPSCGGECYLGRTAQLDLRVSAEHLWGRMSKNLSRDARQASGAGLTAAWRTDEQALIDLMEAHQLHWRAKKMAGSFWTVALRRFHLEALGGGAPIRVLRAEKEGRHMGSLYSLETPNRLCFYQAGRAPSEERVSVGTFLVLEAIRWAKQKGKEAFDFLRGEEAYKRRWGPDLSTELGWYSWQSPSGTGFRLLLEKKLLQTEAALKRRFEN